MRHQPRPLHTILCLLFAAGAFGADYYVDAGRGLDTNNGLSWSAPLATIGQALTLASVTPESDVVRVAEGIYPENLSVPSGVILEGGYPSGGGARDPQSRTTVLQGDRSGSVVFIGPDAEGVTVDGFHVTGGSGLEGGGGIWSLRSEIVLRNNLVYDNEVTTTLGRGGGIGVRGPSPGPEGAVIEDNEVWDNRVLDGNGGGIAVMEFDAPAGPAARLSRNVVRSNQASGSQDLLGRGGGIYVLDNDAVIEDNQIIDNSAEGDGVQTGNGGGLAILGSQAVVTRNLIRGNRARGMGGDFSGSGGGVYGNGFSGEVSENNIQKNTADGGSGAFSAFGGGLFLFSGAPTVSSNTIQGNSLDATGCSSARGGGAYISEVPVSLTGNRFLGNRNYREGEQGDGPCWDDPGCRCFIGGGLWSYQVADGLLLEGNQFQGNEAGDGGGLTLSGSTASTLLHNRISSNSAREFLGAGMEVFFGDPTLINNEIVRNVGDGLVLLGSAADPAAAMLRNVTIAQNGLACPGPNPMCGIGLYTYWADGLDVRNAIIYGNGLSDWVDQPDANNDPTTTAFNFAYTNFGDRLLNGPGNLALNPLFTWGPLGSFYLSRLSTGQGADSPCVDASVDLAADLALDVLTTRSDDVPDSGPVDLGFHYPRFDTSGRTRFWKIERPGSDLLLRFTQVPGADGHRIYRGDLSALPIGFTHQSPFTATQEECFLAAPASFLRITDALNTAGSFYYLAVPVTGGVEGTFGQVDLDGDGIADGERVRPEDDATDEVRNDCP